MLETKTLSDHNYVVFSTASHDQGPLRLEPLVGTYLGWTVKKLEADALNLHLTTKRLTPLPGPASAEKAVASADQLEDFLLGACDACMPKKRPRIQVYWWNEEIAELRSSSLALRRLYQSCLRRVGHPGLQEARSSYSAAKRDLRIAIHGAKTKSWADLCAQVDTDLWRRPYRLVMKKLGTRDPTTDSRGREAQIADFLFPAAPATHWNSAPSAVVIDLFKMFNPEDGTPVFQRSVPEFYVDELRAAARRLPPGRVPDLQGFRMRSSGPSLPLRIKRC